MVDTNSIYDLRFNLSYYGADYSVRGLVDMLQRQEVIVPNFQRGYVWKTDEASSFIESLLLGLPVPSIFLSKDKYSQNFIIIDGQQRLKSLLYFYQGAMPDGKPFKLKGVSKEFQNKSYETLDINDRKGLDHSLLHSIIVSETEQSDKIYYLFERLNTTGNPLKSQEIRSAIYHGAFNDFVKKMGETNEAWRELYHKDKDLRLDGEELILRFIAMHFAVDTYTGNMTNFLNNFMKNNRNFDLYPENQLRQAFESATSFIFNHLGKNAFYKNSTIKIFLYDALMIGASIACTEPEKMDFILFYENLLKEDKDTPLFSNTVSLQDKVVYIHNLVKKYKI